MKKVVFLFCSFILLVSCFSHSSSDAENTFRYWTKSNNLPKDIKILYGEYYQSPHFTLEYEVFLKFKPTKEWWYTFKKQNNLVVIKTSDDSWSSFTNELDWFTPDHNFMVYAASDYEWNPSRYFIDYEKGICYVYETLGM
nr:hypothetical protein [uncultured Psychroserpens sp.]